MLRRIILTVALGAAGAGVYVQAATERATFILTNGERKSGTVVFHGDQRENLINGYLNLGVDNGRDMTFPMEQVAVIDFVGGQPPANELAQLGGSGQMLVTRNGASQRGRFVNMIGGDTLFWENEAGQRQQYAIHDVSRVYLNAESARVAFGYSGQSGAVATTGATARDASIRVDATQRWTDTGITVRRGDRVSFQATGEIQFAPGAGQNATPQGSYNIERRSNSPVPNAGVGALIARVGNSAPFAVGTQGQAVQMRESGPLQLSVNDDILTDNSGFFNVTVSIR